MKPRRLIVYLFIIFGAAILALSIIVFVYWFNFGGELSNRQELWGVFGDFIGGSLNPLFSLAGLVALLMTIALQSQELEDTRIELKKSAEASQAQAQYIAAQQQRDDMFRLINKLSERINNSYNGNFLDGGGSIHSAMMGDHDVNKNDVLSKLYKDVKNTNSRTYVLLRYMESDLKYLSYLILEYEKVSLNSSGSTPLPDFYKAEYSEFVELMHQYGIFKNETAKFYCEYL